MLFEGGRGTDHKLVRKWVHHECTTSALEAPAPAPGAATPGAASEGTGSGGAAEQEGKGKQEMQEKSKSEQSLEGKIRELAKEEAEGVFQNIAPELQIVKRVEEHKLYLPNGEIKQVEGTRHPIYALLMQRIVRGIHVFLTGPTGCGKTHVCAQIAQDLGWRFGYISCSAGASEAHLLGRLLPIEAGGRFAYVSTEFVEIFEQGGLFLFDEIDAADPNMLLCVNAALANGHMRLAARHDQPQAVKHAMFRAVAAANTYGLGADRIYEGRVQLDGATLNRFLFMEMEFDRAVDETLCPGPEFREVREKLWAMRARVEQSRPAMRRVISSRAFDLAYKDMAVGYAENGQKSQGATWEQFLAGLLAGWTEEERARAEGKFE